MVAHNSFAAGGSFGTAYCLLLTAWFSGESNDIEFFH